MNFIDILLVIPLLYGFYTGYSKGFISQLTGLVGGIIAIILGIKLSGYLKVYLVDHQLVNPAWGSVVGFILTVIGILLVLKLAGNITRSGIRWIGFGFLEKLMGAAFGILKWFIIGIVILFFFVKVNTWINMIPDNTIQESIMYPYYQKGFNLLYDWANPMITQA